jgi:[ribosomal protein S5]-alanine N-acetyltransferase
MGEAKLDGRRQYRMIRTNVFAGSSVSPASKQPDSATGAAMKIDVNDQVHLSEFRPSDRDALIAHLNDREIYDRTLRIPFPYTEVDADKWLALVTEITKQQGRPVDFAIRSADEALIGGCGFHSLEVGKSHLAEVGYWLARPFWGRGIMTAVVQRLCQHAFAELGLVKITANVFTDNPASARVLEKCGFVQEGLLRKHYLKDARLLDGKLFALLNQFPHPFFTTATQ